MCNCIMEHNIPILFLNLLTKFQREIFTVSPVKMKAIELVPEGGKQNKTFYYISSSSPNYQANPRDDLARKCTFIKLVDP